MYNIQDNIAAGSLTNLATAPLIQISLSNSTNLTQTIPLFQKLFNAVGGFTTYNYVSNDL